MSKCSNKCTEAKGKRCLQNFRLVKNQKELYSIPCNERFEGMSVIVKEEDYAHYILKDPICNNDSWKKLSTDYAKIDQMIFQMLMDAYNLMLQILPTGDIEDVKKLHKGKIVPIGAKVFVVDSNSLFIKATHDGQYIVTNAFITQ